MTRSRWKNGYVDTYLLNKKEISRTWSRRSIILPDFIGKVVQVHRGNGFVPVKVLQSMVGHKFGEFAFTRKTKSKGKSVNL